MRVLKRSPRLSGLGVALALCALSWGQAVADVTTDRAGSIVIFPKVIADGTRDTLIQLTNTSNLPVQVHCIYLNVSGTCEFDTNVQCTLNEDCRLPGEACVFAWNEANFPIRLTRQQPTIWRVSTGRVIDPSDPPLDPDLWDRDSCEMLDPNTTIGAGRQTCPGIDPGPVIPAPNQPFRGELKCFLVDDTEAAPSGANALKGEAIIEMLPSWQISKYNSINIMAVDGGANLDANLALELDGVEYNACPDYLEAVHYGAGAASGDIIASALGADCAGTGCPVRTEITLIPCTEDFEDQAITSVTANYLVFDEQEIPISTGDFVDAWYNRNLMQIAGGGAAFLRNTTFVRTRINPAGGTRCIAGPYLMDGDRSNDTGCANDDDCGGAENGGVCGPNPGLLGIVEEFHLVDPNYIVREDPFNIFAGTAAVNMHMVGSRNVVEPWDDTEPSGRCRGNVATRCNVDADCAGGFCRDDGAPCQSHGDCTSNTTAELNICDRCIIDTIEVPQITP